MSCDITSHTPDIEIQSHQNRIFTLQIIRMYYARFSSPNTRRLVLTRTRMRYAPVSLFEVNLCIVVHQNILLQSPTAVNKHGGLGVILMTKMMTNYIQTLLFNLCLLIMMLSF